MASISGGSSRRVLLGLLPACLATGRALADQRDPALPDLFDRLREADAVEAPLIEARIRAIWYRHPDRIATSLLDEGVVLLSDRQWSAAYQRFDELVQRAPDFAEAWNQRATAAFLLDELDTAVHDIQRTLALEPHHFEALARLGETYLKLGQPEAALRAFEAALTIYPTMAAVRRRIDELRSRLFGRDI
ncbi:MAG TPA: tetratricopeptide repeat protein [Geminicoccus sp.]|uniref:tetratricopeptide repeat protein n=1 Tax=Geminicoccus sp. TaxID=2024832 RepID=UPI002CD8C3C3|nr:tetratricopeptide repeat protein [Geminicoccus sp.]HWL68571.1 tetratricopeptide repeat protein [Geminicoccus sp.]